MSLGTNWERLAFVALGANLGDAASAIRRAMDQLESFSAQPLLRSSLWQSEPVDCPPGSPPFINAVVALTPQLEETPESLLAKLHALEAEFGRQRGNIRNAPRPLDLDLIAFGNQTHASPELALPHPRAVQRRFVLQPLEEIAPDLILPGQTKTVRELLEGLGCAQEATRVS
jgi:2-amino-4-hydroxy-6-hydroxymethyldihydropteridine diphosphokinase